MNKTHDVSLGLILDKLETLCPIDQRFEDAVYLASHYYYCGDCLGVVLGSAAIGSIVDISKDLAKHPTEQNLNKITQLEDAAQMIVQEYFAEIRRVADLNRSTRR